LFSCPTTLFRLSTQHHTRSQPRFLELLGSLEGANQIPPGIFGPSGLLLDTERHYTIETVLHLRWISDEPELRPLMAAHTKLNDSAPWPTTRDPSQTSPLFLAPVPTLVSAWACWEHPCRVSRRLTVLCALMSWLAGPNCPPSTLPSERGPLCVGGWEYPRFPLDKAPLSYFRSSNIQHIVRWSRTWADERQGTGFTIQAGRLKPHVPASR